MDLAVSEFRLDGRRMFVGITRDVSERKRAEQTFKFLADASATLADLVDYESTLRRVARLAVPFFADWCAVDMLAKRRVAAPRGGRPCRRRQRAEPAEEWERCFPAGPSRDSRPPKCCASGRSEIVPAVTEEVLAAAGPRRRSTCKRCGRWG